ncbi:MAG: 50S ribosomal protein L31 [Anaerolineaceae bacterium]|nr:50S ribosomal protein L31 [Anaerolineaceae bacterium]
MKKEIQPKYYQEAVVTCASCGATWKTGSTQPKLRTEVCSNCHPFFTGQLARLLDVEGQVDRFYKRLQAREQYVSDKQNREEAKTSPKRAIADLEISSRAKDTLSKAGIIIVGDVLERLGEGDSALLDIGGFGQKSLIDLKKELRQLGYKLPEA